MRRRTTVHTTTRESQLPVLAETAWEVVASGRAGRQWYVDAGPFVVRGLIDQAVGGAGRRWDPPGMALLQTGDRVGFWLVREADHDARRLVLEAAVRAPGRVVLTTSIGAVHPDRCRLVQTTELTPYGLLGRAYLAVDLPAREVVGELTHRRLVDDIVASP